MDHTSAVVLGIIYLVMHGTLTLVGLYLLFRRVWDMAVIFLTIGAGIPGIVFLAILTGFPTNFWQLFAEIFGLIMIAGLANFLLQKFIPGRPLSPLNL